MGINDMDLNIDGLDLTKVDWNAISHKSTTGLGRRLDFLNRARKKIESLSRERELPNILEELWPSWNEEERSVVLTTYALATYLTQGTTDLIKDTRVYEYSDELDPISERPIIVSKRLVYSEVTNYQELSEKMRQEMERNMKKDFRQ